MVDDGNGKKIAVHESEIIHLTEAVKEQTELLRTMFGPDGVCPKERSARRAFESSAKTHLKGLWTSIVFEAGAIGFIIKWIINGK